MEKPGKKRGLKEYWIFILGLGIILFSFAAIGIIWSNVNNFEKLRYAEHEDFAANIAKTAENILINKEYAYFYDILNLLTQINFVDYIAVFLDGKKRLQEGSEKGLDLHWLGQENGEIQSPWLDQNKQHLYVKQPMAFQGKKQADIRIAFSLEEYQGPKTGILQAFALIVVLLCILGWLVIYLDTTKRKLNIAYQDLSKTHSKLEQAEYTKSKMIRAISHDAMHTFTAIYHKLFYLSEQKSGKTCLKDSRSDIRNIRENTTSIKRVLENMRDHERIREGNIQIIIKREDIVYWIKFAVGNFTGTLAEKRIQLNTRLVNGPIYVQIDKEIIKSVLMNLLDNAVKYSGDNTKIELWTESTEKEVNIYLKDQGQGIDEKDWEKIYLPFVRLDKKVEKIEGSGLGLFNARQHLRALRGDLSIVASKPGGGTTFCVMLPLGRES